MDELLKSILNFFQAIINVILQGFELSNFISNISKEILAEILGIPTICISIVLFAKKAINFILKRL